MATEATYTKMAETAQRVSADLQRESDRGCVILAFAWMDEQVTSNLQRFLLPSSHVSVKSDELLGAGRPLGDASTKIDLSYRLGLLRSNTKTSLHLFRRLRNDFAHLSSPLSFQTPSVRDRVLAIFDNEQPVLEAVWNARPSTTARASVDEASSGATKALHQMREHWGTKRLFAFTAGILVSALVLIGDTLNPVQPPAGTRQ